jgi:hypothetical protein
MSSLDSAGGELPRLASLAQSARSKSLKRARLTLIWLGVLMAVVNGVLLFAARQNVQAQFDQEIADLAKQGLSVDPEQVSALIDASVRATQLVAGGAAALGVLFIVFGLNVYRYPLPITITGLVLYLGFIALNAVADPLTIFQGLILKILVIVFLANAIRAALAYEKEPPPAAAPGLNG